MINWYIIKMSKIYETLMHFLTKHIYITLQYSNIGRYKSNNNNNNSLKTNEK